MTPDLLTEFGADCESVEPSTEEAATLQQNFRLIFMMLPKCKWPVGLPVEDRMSVLLEASLYAIRTFDPERAQLSTHMCTSMRYYALLAVGGRIHGPLVRVPANLCELLHAASEWVSEIRETHGRLPTAAEWESRGHAPRKARSLVAASVVRFGAVLPAGGRSDDDDYQIDIEDHRPSPFDSDEMERSEALRDAIQRLPARLAVIVRRTCLLGQTLQVVADSLGLSKERVRVLRLRALGILRTDPALCAVVEGTEAA